MIGSVDCRANKLWKGMCMLPCTLAKRTSDSVSPRPVLWGSLHSKKSTSARAVSSIPFPKHSPPNTSATCTSAAGLSLVSHFARDPRGVPLWVCGLRNFRPLANSPSIWEAASIQKIHSPKHPLKLRTRHLFSSGKEFFHALLSSW